MPVAAPISAAPLAQPRRRRRRRRAHRESAAGGLITRCLAGLLGLGALVLALLLAWQHPLGAALACSAVLLTALLARYFWTLWPSWMLGLVPAIALTPWTGWTLIEEFDLLVLASLAGGYLAISGPHRHPPPPAAPVWRRELRWRKLTLLLLGLFMLSAFMAMVHGLVDAGGLDLRLAQGDRDAGQAFRAFKPLLWLSLLLPLWWRVARRVPQLLGPSLSAGLLAGLAAVAWGAAMERFQFTGLSNFNTDYRTTGWFWEMQYGGAALDGALSLLMPFALLALLRARRALPFLIALGLLLLGSYAVLTSFSRALYLALLISLPMLVLKWQRQESRLRRGDGDPASSWLPGQVLPDGSRPLLPAGRAGLLMLILLGVAAGCAWVMFPTSGYRGMLALFGVMALLFAQPPAAAPALLGRSLSGLLGLLAALPLVGLIGLLAMHVDKAAYAGYALCWGAAVSVAWLAMGRRRPWYSPLGDALRAAAWFSCLGGVAVIAWSWGGMVALERSALPLGLIALLWPICQGGDYGRLLQQLSWRARASVLGLLLLLVAVVAAFGGGAYLANRLSTAEEDLGTRLQHWSRTLSALEAEGGWVFGAGAGRFTPVFASELPPNEQIGWFRVIGGREPHLLARGGGHLLGGGELLRLTQRLSAAPAGLVLQFKARNEDDLALHVEVCEKQLLYSGVCIKRELKLQAQADGWRTHRIELGGQGELAGRPLFALAVATQNTELALTGLSLRGQDGRELLRNGDFSQGLERWLPTSERHHLPWHAKNIGLHLMYEQGLVGLLLALALVGLAIGRLSLGSASEHPLAPALLAALVGFGFVGLFDSLLDAPRVAFLFYTLLLLSLGLRAPPPPPVKLPPSPTHP